MNIEPPSDAIWFPFPPTYRRLLVSRLISYFVFFAIGAALVISGKPALIAPALILLPLYGALAFLTIRKIQRVRDRFAANDDGIWRIPQHGASAYIRWN